MLNLKLSIVYSLNIQITVIKPLKIYHALYRDTGSDLNQERLLRSILQITLIYNDSDAAFVHFGMEFQNI